VRFIPKFRIALYDTCPHCGLIVSNNRKKLYYDERKDVYVHKKCQERRVILARRKEVGSKIKS
jgi:hypothetical protein